MFEFALALTQYSASTSLEEDITTLIIGLAIFAVVIIIKILSGHHVDDMEFTERNIHSNSNHNINGVPTFVNEIANSATLKKQADARIAENPQYPAGVKPKLISATEEIGNSIEGFDEEYEIEKIKYTVCEYILATSRGNKDFSKIRELCSKAVLTSAQFGCSSARMTQIMPTVSRVEFVRCEKHALETSLSGLAFSEYDGINEAGNMTHFEATYSFRYSYIYRESTDRKSLKCPHCGEPISDYDATECAACGHYFDSLLMDRSWAITEITRETNRIVRVESTNE